MKLGEMPLTPFTERLRECLLCGGLTVEDDAKCMFCGHIGLRLLTPHEGLTRIELLRNPEWLDD